MEESITIGTKKFGLEHTTITTYDSTGKYYEKKNVETSVDASYDINAYAAVFVGIEVGVNIKNLLEGIVALFK